MTWQSESLMMTQFGIHICSRSRRKIKEGLRGSQWVYISTQMEAYPAVQDKNDASMDPEDIEYVSECLIESNSAAYKYCISMLQIQNPDE